jgi:hypothetical protein
MLARFSGIFLIHSLVSLFPFTSPYLIGKLPSNIPEEHKQCFELFVNKQSTLVA